MRTTGRPGPAEGQEVKVYPICLMCDDECGVLHILIGFIFLPISVRAPARP